MAAWTPQELARLGEAQELDIASERAGGELRRRVPIWAVRVDDDLYVRAASGVSEGWHAVAKASGRARIWSGGVEKDVSVAKAADDAAVLDEVDAGYREKYGRSYASIVERITGDAHRATTLRLSPVDPA